jgi:hypothetical protein
LAFRRAKYGLESSSSLPLGGVTTLDLRFFLAVVSPCTKREGLSSLMLVVGLSVCLSVLVLRLCVMISALNLCWACGVPCAMKILVKVRVFSTCTVYGLVTIISPTNDDKNNARLLLPFAVLASTSTSSSSSLVVLYH